MCLLGETCRHVLACTFTVKVISGPFESLAALDSTAVRPDRVETVLVVMATGNPHLTLVHVCQCYHGYKGKWEC